MHVWLDAIPERAPAVHRPKTRRWLLFLVMVMLTGIALTFWHWTSERAGFAFWFTALGLPFCIWGLLFSLRRFAYKVGQVAAESRNIERERLIESEISRGQRCAWILGTYVQTSFGNKPKGLLTTIEGNPPLVEFSQPRGLNTPIRYVALTEFQKNMAVELKSAISKLAARIQDIAGVLPADINCGLILDCDSDLEDQILEPFTSELFQKTGRAFHLMSGKGLSAFDEWLDRRWEHPAILAVVTLSLPAVPVEGDADAITLMVLSNRPADDFPDAACLHRPERGEAASLTKALVLALLWAGIGSNELRGALFTGRTINRSGDWNKACENSNVTFSLSQQNIGIDHVLGHAGHASPWLSIALADAACKTRGPQVIAAQPTADKDDIWVTVITNDEAPKEMPGNV